MAPPKSSEDGETKEGSSSDSQVTEPMETCSSVASSLLGKRKAETTNAEDPEESEGDGEESEGDGEESEGDGEDSDSGWDKDSFDSREYNPSEDPGFSDEEYNERYRNYDRLVIESKGFFERSEKPCYHWSGIFPVPDDPDDLDKKIREGVTVRQLLGNIASECVEKYNKRENKNVIFDHFLRANFNPGGRTKYYITFAARESDSPDAPLVEYQAKAIREAGETYPILCRPTPPPKKEGDGRGKLEEVSWKR